MNRFFVGWFTAMAVVSAGKAEWVDVWFFVSAVGLNVAGYAETDAFGRFPRWVAALWAVSLVSVCAAILTLVFS